MVAWNVKLPGTRPGLRGMPYAQPCAPAGSPNLTQKKSAWFRNGPFWVTGRAGIRAPSPGESEYVIGARRRRDSVDELEAPVAEEFEPMGMALAGQHLGRAPALALGALTSYEAAMIEEEAE